MIIPIFAAIVRANSILDFYVTENVLTLRFILSLPVYYIWIYLIVIWAKKDKNVGRFFLLFFLIGIYTLFYFKRALKNDWIK